MFQWVLGTQILLPYSSLTDNPWNGNPAPDAFESQYGAWNFPQTTPPASLEQPPVDEPVPDAPSSDDELLFEKEPREKKTKKVRHLNALLFLCKFKVFKSLF